MIKNIEQEVKNVLCELLSIDENRILAYNERLMQDLGATSLDLAEILFALETSFELRLPMHPVPDKLVTVGHLIELVQKQQIKLQAKRQKIGG